MKSQLLYMHGMCISLASKLSRPASPLKHFCLVRVHLTFLQVVCSFLFELSTNTLAHLPPHSNSVRHVTSPNHCFSLFMAASARLEQVRKLVQADIDALPDRSDSQILETESIDYNEVLEYVLLNPALSLTPVTCLSKRSASMCADSNRKDTQVVPRANSERRYIWVKGAESTYNPELIKSPIGPTRPVVKSEPVHLQRGDLASPHHHFTPIKALARYPYKFCDRTCMQQITSVYFDQGKFWEREWDL